MSKTVLSVDDSASMRALVKMTLAGAGYQVIEAADGAEGLAKAQSTAVQIIVTDLNMPRMDGLAFIKEVRKLPAYKGVPILFLTTESDDAKKREAKLAGATGWLVKPFQPDQLLAVVRRVIG
jgi:two-component system chemotaxis response regulator CheY